MSAFLFGPLQQAIHGGPEELPPVPKKTEPPPKMAAPPAPGLMPGQNDKTTSASFADEKRRILRAMPQGTTKTFAGETNSPAPIEKKRLLGESIGKQTTGA